MQSFKVRTPTYQEVRYDHPTVELWFVTHKVEKWALRKRLERTARWYGMRNFRFYR